MNNIYVTYIYIHVFQVLRRWKQLLAITRRGCGCSRRPMWVSGWGRIWMYITSVCVYLCLYVYIVIISCLYVYTDILHVICAPVSYKHSLTIYIPNTSTTLHTPYTTPHAIHHTTHITYTTCRSRRHHRSRRALRHPHPSGVPHRQWPDRRHIHTVRPRRRR